MFLFKAIALILTCDIQSDFIPEINHGYKFVSEAKSYRIIYKSIFKDEEPLMMEIPRSVKEYSLDDNYIIASQVVIQLRELITQEDEQMDKSIDLPYWIIKSKKDVIHGPFNLEEYQNLRESHGVPDDLKLRK